MVCLLEERVCNLVLLWCITVIAHHCKLVKLQSSISDYKPSDLWSYDDIEVAKPQNESSIRLVKNHQGEAYYLRSDDRKITRQNDEDPRDELPSLRNRDHFGSKTNMEIPVGAKSNDGEISISKKITFNGNNSRANNFPLWFNALEKSAMSLPASISFNLKTLYGERKSESTKRPYESPGVVFASKTIPLNTSSLNRNKMKYQQSNYEPEYDEPALPPSLPNLEIIPFVASDALDKPKETVADRKEGIEYIEDETTPTDPADMIKKFSPPVLTEGGFVPRDPTLDELYYEAKFNRTYSSPPQIIITEITSEYRVTEPSLPKVSDIVSEHTQHQYIEYSTMSATTTTQKRTTTTTTTTKPPPTHQISTTTTTTENPPTTPEVPPTPVIHFLTTKAANHSTVMPLLKHTSTSTTSTTTTTTSTTTEDPSIEESEEGGTDEEESEDEDEETIPLSETEPMNKEPAVNNTKEEPAEPEDNFLLSNILTMIFDDYAAPSKEKTTVAPPPSPSKKTSPAIKSTTPATKPTTSSIPPFKHVYIPPSTRTTTTTTTTSTSTEGTSTVKSMDKMGFISTRFSNNNTSSSMNETQQNQIKYVSLPQTFTYNQPVPKSTPKPVVKERPPSHNEIYHSMKSDSVISGLLKLSGCNIFGKMYKTGEQIDELTEPCSRCICSEAGVHCIQTKC